MVHVIWKFGSMKLIKIQESWKEKMKNIRTGQSKYVDEVNCIVLAAITRAAEKESIIVVPVPMTARSILLFIELNKIKKWLFAFG